MTRRNVNLLLALLMVLTLALASASARPAHAQATNPEWIEIANPLREARAALVGNCFDSTRLNTYLYSPRYGGTLSIDLTTGKETKLNERRFYYCHDKTGFLYLAQSIEQATPLIMNLRDGKLTETQYWAKWFAQDGSLWAYSDGQPLRNQTNDLKMLYASPDGGITWRKSNLPEGVNVDTWAISPADGRILYLASKNAEGDEWRYDFYISQDAGVNWQKRGSFKLAKDRQASFYSDNNFLRSQTNTILLVSSIPGEYSYRDKTVHIISTDGGTTFSSVELPVDYRIYLPNGMVKYEYGANDRLAAIQYSPDYGKTWFLRTLPAPNMRYLTVLPASPNTILACGLDTTDAYYSFDQGQNWRKVSLPLADINYLQFSPTAPTTILKTAPNGKVYRATLPELDASHTVATPARTRPDGIYFPETQHNLSPLFKKYWEANGGLAQFGYPKTEAFREYNPADGKIYTVQYFERNRFEYHPENRGTQYEVLLGLLGNQLTEKYRAEKHGAFNYFEDKKYPGGIYFPETGHNLRNTFKEYWEKNGGLAIYGYPTSEEFYEVNPDDGKTYVVQYFERNRFEWHPENKGTRYEVLLGLLGNALLRDKGWLTN